MSLFSRLFGTPMPPLPHEGPILIISYSILHKIGMLVVGTLSLDGDRAEAQWSTTFAGNKTTKPVEVTPQFFRTLWSAMDSLPEFKKGWIRDLSAEPVPSKHNISAIIVEKANPKKFLFERRHVINIEDASELLRDLLFQAGFGSITSNK